MKRQFAIFLMASLLVITLGVAYNPQVVADLAVLYPAPASAPGTKVVLSPDDATPFTTTTQEAYLLDAQHVVARRLDQLNLTGYYGVIVQHDQLEVTLPRNDNTPYILGIITYVGEVEFIDGGTGSPPIGQQVETGPQTIPAQGIYRTLFSGREIATIVPPDSTGGEIFYQIILQPAVAERLNFIDAPSRAAYMCLAIDKQVINCSRMYHWSNNTVEILPNLSSGTDISLADLAIFLNSGPLPMSLEVVTD
jgi:hypothetical protein